MSLYGEVAQIAVNRSRGALEEQGEPRLALNAVESRSMRKLLSLPPQGKELWRLSLAMAWSFTWCALLKRC